MIRLIDPVDDLVVEETEVMSISYIFVFYFFCITKSMNKKQRK